MFTYPIMGAGGSIYAGLLTDLRAWYTMGDDGGVNVDSHNGYNLTNSGVTTTAGKKGNAGDFVAASGDTMYRNQSVFQMSTGTLAFWCKQTAQASSQWLFHIGNTVAGDMDCYTSGPGLFFRVNNDTVPCHFDSANMLAIGKAATNWVLYIMSWNATNAWLWGDLAAANTQSSGTYPGITSTGTFTIGERATFGQNYNGDIDEFAIWSRILTSDERTLLWNSGAGITYSDL